MSRRLDAQERAIWAKVTQSVRPIRAAPTTDLITASAPLAKPPLVLPPKPSAVAKAPMKGNGFISPPPQRPDTLDRSWDKSIATGRVSPDRTIDLHGHNLASAHALLNHALGDAIRQGARVILLITGKPAVHNPRMPPTGRGVIRASVIDWIEAGPHANRVATIRGAHPRHGGNGALYVILRRPRLA